VIQTRDVEEGTGVGYGMSWRAASAQRLATISLGYADGWPRRTNASARYEGLSLPFAGRVSMDSIVLDVSALPPGLPRAGELVEVIGEHQTVDDLAALSGTIGYEILTGLGQRFHRRYL
jgi:alanine racemase